MIPIALAFPPRYRDRVDPGASSPRERRGRLSISRERACTRLPPRPRVCAGLSIDLAMGVSALRAAVGACVRRTLVGIGKYPIAIPHQFFASSKPPSNPARDRAHSNPISSRGPGRLHRHYDGAANVHSSEEVLQV